MRKIMAATLLATAALAGCDNNADTPFPPPGSEVPPPTALMSVLEFARSLIGTRTCDTTTPAAVNGQELSDNETLLTDLGSVNLGCSA